jgi:hypothetical protein
MVSLDGATCVLEASAHTTQTNSFTWAKTHAHHNHVDGGGVGFGVNSKHLQVQVKANVLIMCSPYTWGKKKGQRTKRGWNNLPK